MTGRCPHPEKRSWRSRRDAIVAAKIVTAHDKGMRAYRCECGRFHLTSKAD